MINHVNDEALSTRRIIILGILSPPAELSPPTKVVKTLTQKHQYMSLKCGDKVVKRAHAPKHVCNFTTDMLLKIMDHVPIFVQQLADF